MLACIALALGTVILFKMKRERYAWVTLAPAAWLGICTLTAGWQKLFSGNPAIGFLAHAQKFSNALETNQIVAPAKSIADMHRVVFNDYVNASLTGHLGALVIAMACFGIAAILKALTHPYVTAHEAVPSPAE